MNKPAPHPRSIDDPDPQTLAPAPGGAAIPLVVPHCGPPPAPADGAAGFALSLAGQDRGTRARGIPVLGGLAAIFGVAALFKAPVVLAPLGIFFALAALLRGQAGLAAIGGVSGVVALAISPVFWTLIGLAWLGSWLLG